MRWHCNTRAFASRSVSQRSWYLFLNVWKSASIAGASARSFLKSGVYLMSSGMVLSVFNLFAERLVDRPAYLRLTCAARGITTPSPRVAGTSRRPTRSLRRRSVPDHAVYSVLDTPFPGGDTPANSANARQCRGCGRRRPARIFTAYGLETLSAAATFEADSSARRGWIRSQ